MAKLIALILTTAMVALLVAAEDQPAPIEARVEIVQDIATFKAANPGVELIPLDIQAKSDDRQQRIYSIGKRVSGDRLVASGSTGPSWSSSNPVSVATTLSYPRSGTGAVVTYVHVVVNQSSNQGRGYISAGGIGQRRITLVIESPSTKYLYYSAQIYGR